MSIRSILRATELMRCLAQRTSGVSLTELAAATGLSKSTVHRILRTLTDTQFVTADPLSGRYFPGHVFLQVALSSESFQQLKRVARPHLERLRDETLETASLVVLRGADRVTIDVALGRHELKAVPEIGKTAPIYAGAAGKALLAALPEEDLQRLVATLTFSKVARNTIESPDDLLSELKDVRARGYALSIEETVPGQGAIAAPVSCAEAVASAINLSVPTVRFSGEMIERAAPGVLRAARAISESLPPTNARMDTAPARNPPRRRTRRVRPTQQQPTDGAQAANEAILQSAKNTFSSKVENGRKI